MPSNKTQTDLAERNTRELMQVALGRDTGDLAVVNANLVNVYTGEIQPDHSIVTAGKWVAYVGPHRREMIGSKTEVIDAAGKTVIPGLIDGHTHLALFFSIAEFLKYAVPGGTTTVVTEALEPYAVGGYDGFVDFLESLAGQPIKLFATVPPMVSISRHLRGIDGKDLERLLAREEILGMGESYWQGVFQDPETLLPGMQATLLAGKTLEGHSAGARDEKLAAYAALGVTSCHEPITADEVLARMRLGMHVMAREGNVRRDLKTIAQVREKGVDLRRLTIASDGVDPKILLEEGYTERLVQKAIDYGFDPIEAIQMTTLNVAEHFNIDHLVGGIAPGRYADMAIVPHVDEMRAEVVVSNGRVVAADGKLVDAARHHDFSQSSRNSIAFQERLTPEDFTVRVDGKDRLAEVSIIEMVTDLVTRKQLVSLPVRSGRIACDPARGLNKVAAIDRNATPCRLFTGFIRGFNLVSGAVGGSAAWDTSNLIVVGADEADMAMCINRVRDLQGGVVVCRSGEVMEELALPNLGVISDLSMTNLSAKLAAVSGVLKRFGVTFPDPLLTLATLTGAAIPFFRISEDGLVDLKSGATQGVLAADRDRSV